MALSRLNAKSLSYYTKVQEPTHTAQNTDIQYTCVYISFRPQYYTTSSNSEYLSMYTEEISSEAAMLCNRRLGYIYKCPQF